MRSRQFGSTGIEVPTVGLGTWNMERDEKSAVLSAVQRALELGVTHLDTAEMYGVGAVETLLGEALKGRRDRAFLVSKVLPQNASKAGTVAACERSLRRLGTDHLDCYLLHWPGPHPLGETVAAFEGLVQAGKIKSWGVSNFDVHDLEALVRIAGPGKIACNQVLYHLRERAIEHAVLPWCEAHGVALVAYSPYGGEGGFPEERSPGGRALAKIAESLRATPRQVALAFLARHPNAFVIPKTGHPSRVVELAAAGELVLEEGQVRALEAAFPRGRAKGLPTG